jgi:hypothetical protein
LLHIVPKSDLFNARVPGRGLPGLGDKTLKHVRAAQGSTFLSEGFHLDRRGLFRQDERGNLPPAAIGGRALDLLGVLVERHGEILSKAAIMAAVWPKAAVEEADIGASPHPRPRAMPIARATQANPAFLGGEDVLAFFTTTIEDERSHV